jgi:hypothetical protein
MDQYLSCGLREHLQIFLDVVGIVRTHQREGFHSLAFVSGPGIFDDIVNLLSGWIGMPESPAAEPQVRQDYLPYNHSVPENSFLDDQASLWPVHPSISGYFEEDQNLRDLSDFHPHLCLPRLRASS